MKQQVGWGYEMYEWLWLGNQFRHVVEIKLIQENIILPKIMRAKWRLGDDTPACR